jgi:hypothetical protein
VTVIKKLVLQRDVNLALVSSRLRGAFNFERTPVEDPGTGVKGKLRAWREGAVVVIECIEPSAYGEQFERIELPVTSCQWWTL